MGLQPCSRVLWVRDGRGGCFAQHHGIWTQAVLRQVGDVSPGLTACVPWTCTLAAGGCLWAPECPWSLGSLRGMGGLGGCGHAWLMSRLGVPCWTLLLLFCSPVF